MAFHQLKNNFAIGQRVVIGETCSKMDGKTGYIGGKSSEHVVDHYIVILDDPYMGNIALVLPEGCLDREHDDSVTAEYYDIIEYMNYITEDETRKLYLIFAEKLNLNSK